jgi:hypothetical protein
VGEIKDRWASKNACLFIFFAFLIHIGAASPASGSIRVARVLAGVSPDIEDG